MLENANKMAQMLIGLYGGGQDNDISTEAYAKLTPMAGQRTANIDAAKFMTPIQNELVRQLTDLRIARSQYDFYIENFFLPYLEDGPSAIASQLTTDSSENVEYLRRQLRSLQYKSVEGVTAPPATLTAKNKATLFDAVQKNMQKIAVMGYAR